MKQAEALAVLAALIGSLAGTAYAQQGGRFPVKPVRLIVPLPPGGGADLLARSLAARLTDIWGQTVVIDHRSGAGGVIGTELAAKAPADGYTLLHGYTAPLSINVSLRKLPYDAIRDFQPITLAALAPNVLVVNPNLPASSVKELIAVLKARPGQVNYASAGNGSSPHLSAELFKLMTQTAMNHVPYKGAGPALVDVIAGHVALYIGSLPSSLPHIRSGRVRGLAVTGARRSPSIPDLPTVDEAGVPGFESSQWYGYLTPAKAPPSIVERLERDFIQALKSSNVADPLAAQGFEVVASSRSEFGRYMRNEIAKWAKVIQGANIKGE
jgi:tripartite-type tricarboxylate transporter receptor subunit TctC